MSGAVTSRILGALNRLGRMARSLAADNAGNTMVISAAAILMLIAAAGGGIDISRAYMTKANLQSACDAGVLAGRKALAKSGTYGNPEKAKAEKMFNFNLRPDQTQATDVVFDSVSHDDGSVTGTASATIPTIVMKIFKFTDFDLSVECSAELQMASADVMFVLDTTGSMAGSRIQGLRDAIRDFHKTVAQAVIDKDKTVIRYAFVPYSSSVNASGILASGAMKSEWFASVSRMPTKVAVFETPYYLYEKNDPTTSASVNETTTTTSSACKSETVNGGGPAPTATTETNYVKVSWNKSSTWSSTGPCVRTKTVKTTAYKTVTVYQFDRYEYRDWDVPSAGLLPGGSLPIVSRDLSTSSGTPYYVDVAGTYDLRTLALKKQEQDSGNTHIRLRDPSTPSTSACIEERGTVVNLAMNPVPDDAFDLNINDAPDPNDERTKWRAMWRDMYYTRSSLTDGSRAPSPACPAPMRQFEEVDTNSTDVPDWLDDYLDDELTATGNTYHDIGMIWGARLASTNGMYSANVLEGDRNSVSRHIIFMTDGAMEPSSTVYNAYGVEAQEHRVAPAGSGSGQNSTLATYHTNRFLAACRKAREEGYTIWVIGFGTSITTAMRTCSSANRAYPANSTDELKAAFRYIAGQVADLRLNK